MTTKYGEFSAPVFLRPNAAVAGPQSNVTSCRQSTMKIGGFRGGKVTLSLSFRIVLHLQSELIFSLLPEVLKKARYPLIGM